MQELPTVQSPPVSGLSEGEISELSAEVRALAAERDAVVLAHNYQLPELQDLADYVGDSLGLSRAAAASDASVIAFCGVHFMAETADMLTPDQVNLILPDLSAGCSMADMANHDDTEEAWDTIHETLGKLGWTGRIVPVTYVNSSAEVKAESDICCTSANAVKVTKSVGTKEVFLAPDRNLAQWVARHTDQNVSCWDGYCPTH